MPEFGLGGGFQVASQAAFSGSPRASQGCQARCRGLKTADAQGLARSMPSGGVTDPILLPHLSRCKQTKQASCLLEVGLGGGLQVVVQAVPQRRLHCFRLHLPQKIYALTGGACASGLSGLWIVWRIINKPGEIDALEGVTGSQREAADVLLVARGLQEWAQERPMSYRLKSSEVSGGHLLVLQQSQHLRPHQKCINVC